MEVLETLQLEHLRFQVHCGFSLEYKRCELARWVREAMDQYGYWQKPLPLQVLAALQKKVQFLQIAA